MVTILDTARTIRRAAHISLIRYDSVLAMAQCIAGDANAAITTAASIDRTFDKYKDIYRRILRCGTSDREALFENPEISK